MTLKNRRCTSQTKHDGFCLRHIKSRHRWFHMEKDKQGIVCLNFKRAGERCKEHQEGNHAAPVQEENESLGSLEITMEEEETEGEVEYDNP